MLLNHVAWNRMSDTQTRPSKIKKIFDSLWDLEMVLSSKEI